MFLPVSRGCVQHLVMAERVLQQNLDAPILWLQDRQSGVLRNRMCSRYLKAQGLERRIWMSPQGQHTWDTNHRSRAYTCAAVFQAIHGCAYLVYGTEEVRRLMFAVWELEGGWVMQQPWGRGDATGPLLPSLAETIGLGTEWDAAKQPLTGFTSRQ